MTKHASSDFQETFEEVLCITFTATSFQIEKVLYVWKQASLVCKYKIDFLLQAKLQDDSRSFEIARHVFNILKAFIFTLLFLTQLSVVFGSPNYLNALAALNITFQKISRISKKNTSNSNVNVTRKNI